jgi:hypothetical protein
MALVGYTQKAVSEALLMKTAILGSRIQGNLQGPPSAPVYFDSQAEERLGSSASVADVWRALTGVHAVTARCFGSHVTKC